MSENVALVIKEEIKFLHSVGLDKVARLFVNLIFVEKLLYNHYNLTRK